MTVATLGVRIPTIARLRAAGRDVLRAAESTAGPSLEADVLLGHVIGFGRAQLMAYGEALVDATRAAAYAALVERRRAGEPVAYLIGERDFFGMRFAVTPATLIPRPETETLIEVARHLLHETPPTRILDLGTGSGCLAIAAAHVFPGAEVWATDASAAACEVARTNAAQLGYGERVTVVEHHFSDLLPPEIETPVDLILCNPPYLTERELETAAPDVRECEPRDALDGGSDGLYHYPDVIRTAHAALRRDGLLVLEIGIRQALSVRVMLAPPHWGQVSVHRDLAGRDRVVVARRHS